MLRYVLTLFLVALSVWLSQGEYNDILPGTHMYEVFPTRKIFKMNFQWNCKGWFSNGAKKDCEEKSGPKVIRFYRKEFKDEPEETLTMRWYPEENNRTLYLTSNYRQLNDYIEMEMQVPLDLWDYDYADANTQYTNISIQLTGSHIVIWYNDYKICNVWLRDMNEDLTYTTHVKLESGFYFEDDDKKGQLYWYYGDESMWCWENCSQANVYNFSGYYDEVLSPRTDSYQAYEKRNDDDSTKPTYCTYFNCTRRWENYPRCLMMNFTAFNQTSQKDQVLLDLRCVNDSYVYEEELKKAKHYWSSMNVTIKHKNPWYQKVPDDPTGVGIANGTYKCLQRDYCHDLRPFQLFNYEGSAHMTTYSLGLLAMSLLLWTQK